MDTFFKELGDTVLLQWKRKNFSLAEFPKIAAAALTKQPPAKRVDLAAFMRDFLLTEEQPSQTDSPFGEPEMIVYSHSRFYIQLLFWMDGTTAIHQHAFSGAFHVMLGSSIHAHYAFENARAVTPYLSVGDVKMTNIEILETGRTLPIASGHQTIHSLFHLDSPSITVVVRTQHDPGTGPQFNYHPPHLAVDPLHSDMLTTRRTQLLDVLERTEDPAWSDLVLAMLADLDFERGFYILRHCMEPLQQTDMWDTALKVFGKKHGSLASGIEATLEEEFRRNIIKSLRGSILQPEHRFFLALLMNAPTRSDLLALVAQRFGQQSPRQQPIDIVLRWAEELMEVSDQGVSLLDASFPETLQIDPNLQGELFLAAFRQLIKPEKKMPPALRSLSSTDLQMLHTGFANSTLSLFCK